MPNEIKIDAIVCPKQKLVKIVIPRKKGKYTVIKTYRFKQDIPFKYEQRTVTRYSFGEWAVSEREYQKTINIGVWDNKTIESIKKRTIDFYRSQSSEVKCKELTYLDGRIKMLIDLGLQTADNKTWLCPITGFGFTRDLGAINNYQWRQLYLEAKENYELVQG